MNLHNMAVGAISQVNPRVQATLRRSNGYTTAIDGERTPLFTDTVGSIQVQGIANEQLYYLDAQGFQGVLRKVYLYGNWNGIIKADRDGGDMLIFGGHSWLVVKVEETWADWCGVIVCQQ